jgi:integral membrane sensor domain MASE1
MPRLSLGLIIAVLLSLVANICLAQNYTQSLISEVNDGIGISNFVADIIIVSESWSTALFKSYFENSVIITLILILLLIISVFLKKKDRKWGYYGQNIR